MAKNFLGFYKNVLDSKSKNNILHNIYLLYIVFAIAVVDLFYLLMGSKWMEILVFLGTGLLVSFFSKNMVVILILCMVVTFLFSNGAKSLEGFANDEEEENMVADSEAMDESMMDADVDESMDEAMDADVDESMDEAMDADVDESMMDADVINGVDVSKLSTLDQYTLADSAYSSLKKPEIKPFEVADQVDIHNKIDELMNRQKVLIEKMNEHKPVLESITSLGKTLGMIK